jgi:hypothetical protein
MARYVGRIWSSTVLLKTLVAVAALSGAVCLSTPAANAAKDTTPPTVTLKPMATFVNGTTIGPMSVDPDDGTPLDTHDITMVAQWTARDTSGICGSSNRGQFGDGPDDWSIWSNATSLTAATTDYSDQEGGGIGKLQGYDIRVRDCADNITQNFVSFYPIVWQEDGSSYSYWTTAADGSSTTVLPHKYSGTWASSTCSCFSGGQTQWTKSSGASVTFTLNSPVPTPIALVMEKAPDRGKAQVLVDGVLRATPDTYSATKRHRSIVWISTAAAGVHTVTVRNLATSGHPRIDVDAFLTSEDVSYWQFPTP